MKKIILTIIPILSCVLIFAQNDIDAIRYSNYKYSSTARSIGMGGASGSMGADASSLSINPAALAQLKNGEFNFSTSFLSLKNQSTYIGNKSYDNLNAIIIPNIALLFANQVYDKKSKWKNYNFGLSMGRVNDFNRIVNYNGINTQNTFMDYFADRAEGLTPKNIRGTDDDFDYGFTDFVSMAWEGYLIDSISHGKFVSNINPANHNIYQKQVIESSGGMQDYNMALSGNYDNKVYIGGAITYTYVNFQETKRFTEVDDIRTVNANSISEYTFTENLTTYGGGISGKIGIIVVPVPQLRIGLSSMTPQVLKLNDKYTFGLVSILDDNTKIDLSSKNMNYEYKISTPQRTTFSACYIINKKGLITSDIDFVNYNTMRLRPTNQFFEKANTLITEKYGQQINIRIGGEIVQNNFRYRLGFSQYGNPLKDKSVADLQTNIGTIGFGIKEKNWSLDFAYQKSLGKDVYQPYVINNAIVPMVKNNINTGNFTMTYVSKF